MAGAVAHDYNNLLTVILGYTEIVLRRLASDDPSRTDLQSVHRAGEQARALADQLLTLSRRSVVSPQVVDPCSAVDSLKEVVRRLATSSIVVACALDERTGSVLVDPGQFNQIVLNLVMNAVDAMPGGGELAIDVEPAGDRVILRVTDSGAGMDDATLARCLEPFFTTKRRSGGTGLGLATVHAVVTQAGGDVDVRSAPGAGTTVTVSLPSVRIGALASVNGSADDTPRPHDGTVLLVEDEDEVRGYAATVLRGHGYAVEEAASGAEALAGVEAGLEFDVVVTDVVMPGMSGVELARRIEELRPGMPVLFVSGFAEDPILQGSGGRMPFLPKPYRPDALLHSVRQALEAS
jgi:two-component system cell cycle sensor histidine kinase/response regulator CckA